MDDAAVFRFILEDGGTSGAPSSSPARNERPDAKPEASEPKQPQRGQASEAANDLPRPERPKAEKQGPAEPGKRPAKGAAADDQHGRGAAAAVWREIAGNLSGLPGLGPVVQTLERMAKPIMRAAEMSGKLNGINKGDGKPATAATPDTAQQAADEPQRATEAAGAKPVPPKPANEPAGRGAASNLWEKLFGSLDRLGEKAVTAGDNLAAGTAGFLRELGRMSAEKAGNALAAAGRTARAAGGRVRGAASAAANKVREVISQGVGAVRRSRTAKVIRNSRIGAAVGRFRARRGAAATAAKAAAGTGAKAAGGAAAGSGAGAGAATLASVGAAVLPIAAAAGAATAALMAAAAAGRAFGESLKKRAEELRPFSAALADAQARMTVRRINEETAAGRQLGRRLARFEESSAQVGMAIQRIGDGIKGVLLSAFNEEATLLGTIADKLTENRETTERLSSKVLELIPLIGPLLRQFNGSLWNTVLKKLNEWLGGQEAGKFEGDILSIFGDDQPLSVMFGGRTFRPNGETFERSTVRGGPRPALELR